MSQDPKLWIILIYLIGWLGFIAVSKKLPGDPSLWAFAYALLGAGLVLALPSFFPGS